MESAVLLLFGPQDITDLFTGKMTLTDALRDKLHAAIRFAGSLIRAVNPHAERPPFPDLNLANIGGAIIPVLGRRWRASAARRKR